MIPLILFILLGLTILILFEWRARRQAPAQKQEAQPAQEDGECCGEHLVCERDTLRKMQTEIVYYDDEELDALAERNPDTYTEQERKELEDVFTSLKEDDIQGWVHSLQLRHIELTPEIKEEALLILREQRKR